MSLAFSFALGCLSIMARMFTSIFYSVNLRAEIIIPFMLCSLMATYYSIKMTKGKTDLKWLLYSIIVFLSSSYLVFNLLRELPIVGF